MRIRSCCLSIVKYIIITLILIFVTLNLIELIKLFKSSNNNVRSRRWSSREGGGSSKDKFNTNSLLKEHKKKFTVTKGSSLTSSSSSFNNITDSNNNNNDYTNIDKSLKSKQQQQQLYSESIIGNNNNPETRTESCLLNPPNLSHTNLPTWIKTYFQWHYKTRCFEETEQNDKIKYLIVVCLDRGIACGGLADRLKPIPYYVHYANMTNRVLLFHWEKPSNIESYLSPSQLNFTLPSWLSLKHVSRVQISGTKDNNKKYLNSNERIITAKLQTWDAGRLYYDEYVGPPYFNEIFHHLFRSIFIPIPPLQTVIDNTMLSFNLTSNNYVAVHVRARYPTSEIKTKDKGGALFTDYKDKVVDWSLNALNCAIQIDPNTSHIYFASDSNEAVNYIQYESPYVTAKKIRLSNYYR